VLGGVLGGVVGGVVGGELLRTVLVVLLFERFCSLSN
jgi:hypothetical protein